VFRADFESLPTGAASASDEARSRWIDQALLPHRHVNPEAVLSPTGLLALVRCRRLAAGRR
jgi:hypothetical protein